MITQVVKIHQRTLNDSEMSTEAVSTQIQAFLKTHIFIPICDRSQGKRFPNNTVSVSGFFRELKVARYSFSGSIPPKFERKLRRHKQRFVKINTTVVLDKDENLL